MADCLVESFMTSDVLSIEPDTSLVDITCLMSDNKLSCILVASNNKPLGIITERDIVKFLSQTLTDQQAVKAAASNLTANDLMSHKLITANTEHTLSEALILCVVNGVRHLPVINKEGILCGVITYTDIANELLETNQQLQDLSLVDPLTGIGNRRAMELEHKSLHSLSQRYSYVYSIIMIDIDYFKKYNDHYGHQQGDKALQEVAHCIEDCLRESDRLFRYGGEEFLVMLPQTDQNGAMHLSQRIIENLRGLKIPHSKSPQNIVTVSCGVGVYGESGADNNRNDVIKQADNSLYIAKENGRNQVAAAT